MSRPFVQSFTQWIYDELEPVQFAEANLDFPLLKFLNSMGVQFQEVDDYVRDTPDGPGWSLLLDVDRCPEKALPWLGQTVGVVVPGGLTVDQERELIKSTPNWKRGSIPAMVGAAKISLTGNKTVNVRERYLGSAYKIKIATYTAETPDPALTERLIRTQKAGGVLLTYETTDGQDFRQLRDNHGFATFRDARDAYATFEEMRDDTP